MRCENYNNLPRVIEVEEIIIKGKKINIDDLNTPLNNKDNSGIIYNENGLLIFKGKDGTLTTLANK